MGSLVGRKKPHVFLITVAAFILFGLLSTPVSAEESVEQRKLQMLQLLGLNGADPAVIRAAEQAETLYAVDVVPGKDNVSVILQLSKLPAYISNRQDKRLVIDLNNTVNLAPASVQPGQENTPIRQVRNSQYKVSPSLISRVVLDLNEEQVPNISTSGTNIIITAPLQKNSAEAKAAKPASNTTQAPAKVITVPAVKVDTASPKVDVMLAQVQEPLVPPAEIAPAPQPEQNPDSSPIIQTDSDEQLEFPEETAPQPEESDEIADLMETEAAQTTDEVAASEKPAPQKATPSSEINAEAEDQVVQIPRKPAVQPRLVKAPPIPAAQTVPPAGNGVTQRDNLVTLTFRDADLSAVLDILARKGDLNILAGKDVRGTVTVRLVDVPFDVALNAVLNVNGYGYIQTDNIIRVLPLSQLGSKVETETETFTLSYAEANKAKSTLAGLLTTNGTIDVDERTNMIIVTDVAVNLDRIRNLIPQIDRRVQQVLIEVLIIDSVLSDAADLGITWKLTDTDDNTLTKLGDRPEEQDNIAITLPTPNGIEGFNLMVGTLIGDIAVNAVIEALVENTDSRILANPKILTVDNEQASIEIIEEWPYSDVTQTSSGGQLSNITFKEIGTKLEVKPQVTHDEHVILWLTPEQNSFAGVTNGIPIVDTRKAETTLIVKNHQTVVLGGLRENRKISSVSKVPLLGDLPGIKYVFRSVGSENRDSELLVFLTVHIVESPPLTPSYEVKFDELGNTPRKPSVSIDLIR